MDNSSAAAGGHREYTLQFVRSAELDLPVVLRIASFQGHRPKVAPTTLLQQPTERHAGLQQDLPTDLYVVVQLWADNRPLTIPFRTSHSSWHGGKTWNEAISLPIKYRDLPLSAQLTCTVYDIKGPPFANSVVAVGGATLALFGKKAVLKKGKQRLRLWPGREADGRVRTSTPSKIALGPEQTDEMGRLEKLVKKHERGDVPRLDWLDRLAFRQIEKIHAVELEKSTELYLYIDLPRFDWPVVFSEPEYPPLLQPTSISAASTVHAAMTPLAQPMSTSAFVSSLIGDLDRLFTILDPELARENPVEAKHRRLIRSHRSSPLDRELKPNAVTRDELNDILNYPPTQPLTPPQRDLIWHFRFYLTKDKRALTKFLKSVVWSDPGEAQQAVDVFLPSWVGIEIEDALELLGPGEAFRDRRVRSYAVKQIARADDEELMLYLLQLVQALKFEPSQTNSSPTASRHRSRHAASRTNAAEIHSLEDFLVERSVKNRMLGNHLYWYLMVEMADQAMGKMYKQVGFKFRERLSKSEEGGVRLDEVRRQAEFITSLSQLARELRLSKDARPKKIDRLRAAINDPKLGLGSFTPIPLPLDAKVSIVGIEAETSTVFKSNLFPLRLQLLTEDNGPPYPVIFKNGDDLRQDQLVIQLFTLMDRLLRLENLDLKLMPYKVLATATLDGMVQFVPSRTLGDISSEYSGSLIAYLRDNHPDEGSVGTFGVQPDVLDTFVRSCAGYCVLTYILGVGDRHLDNLLLSSDGHFFHVDFGYILGRDPKPFPPAVKLSKEMVDAMGGMQSAHYARFQSLCYTAFTILRKNANLILNLIALMVNGDIPDIKLEPDKAVSKVQEKFRLDLSEEEAVAVFRSILNETSSWASVLDRLHAAAQFMRT